MRFPEISVRTRTLLAAACVFVPASAWSQVVLNAGDSIQQAVDQSPAGTTFILNPGIYRLQSVQPRDGDSFVGAQWGVILSGAQVLNSFGQEGGLWVAYNQYQQGQINGYCDAQHPGCMFPEDLFYDGNPLLHVTDISQVHPGSWFFDYANHKIYFADDPNGHVIETSVARSAFYGQAANVTISGMCIEKYAVPAQFGAIGDQYPGANWIISNTEERWNHGAGIFLGSGSQALNNLVHHNGQKGIGGNGQNILVQGNEISFNNWGGFDMTWEAGGAKFAQTNGLVVRSNFVHDNIGNGMWNDIDSIDTLYEGNTVTNNIGGAGIAYEISYSAVIRNNVVQNNSWYGVPWMWGAQILIQNSSNVMVYGNIVDVSAGYGNGIGIIQQDRGSGAYGPHISANNAIYGNSITYHGAQGSSGEATDFNEQTLISSQSNIFDYNWYHVTDPAAAHWMWEGGQNWGGMQAMGQDMHSSLDTNVAAQ
ncbi:MAG TPA: right-handed parallel beta-helix repeat-containing protein [Bryobacteraceae bacterium]